MKQVIKSLVKKIPLFSSIYRHLKEIVTLNKRLKTSIELMEYRFDKIYSMLLNRSIIIGENQIISRESLKVIYASEVKLCYKDKGSDELKDLRWDDDEPHFVLNVLNSNN